MNLDVLLFYQRIGYGIGIMVYDVVKWPSETSTKTLVKGLTGILTKCTSSLLYLKQEPILLL